MLIKFAVQDFMDERNMMNLTRATLYGYEVFFKEFQSYMRENDILDIEDVSTSVVRGYLLHCKTDRNNSPSTLNSKLKNLRALFNFLLENEYIDSNPCIKIKKQKIDTRIEVFTDAHIRQMCRHYRRLKRYDHEFTAYRNLTVIITLLGTGIRIGELRNLKWSDISQDMMVVYGKNRKQESVPLTKKVYDELIEWKEYLTRYFNGTGLEYVFPTRASKQMSYEATKSIFKRLQDVMNFDDVRVSAHTFRHTFAHRYITNGGDVFSLQKILRHSDITMTEKYMSMWGNNLKEQNDKYNPLNNLNI